jgi:hypothetical protein
VKDALWSGYGPPVDPQQWHAAAEWLMCRSIHGGLDEVEAEAARIGISVTAMFVIVDACAEALQDAADRVSGGKTEEACCPDRQRRNRAYQLEQRERNKPS